jgi:hypothetical protein
MLDTLLVYAKIIDEYEMKNTPDYIRSISNKDKSFMYGVLLKCSIRDICDFMRKYNKDESFRTFGTRYIYNCALAVINMLCEEC